MTDLERFFRQLVQTLAAADASRLRQPIAVAGIPELIPYRTFRRALELDSAEDYELVLLRLCAGEGGFARTEPADLRASFQAEVASPNPDLSVLESGAAGEVTLSASRVALALATTAESGRAYAPPSEIDATPTPVPLAEPDDALPLDEVRVAQPRRATPAEDTEAEVSVSGGSHCSYCGGTLPEGRVVNYCPHCGQSQAVTHCPECHSEVEIGWRHCISCGYALGS